MCTGHQIPPTPVVLQLSSLACSFIPKHLASIIVVETRVILLRGELNGKDCFYKNTLIHLTQVETAYKNVLILASPFTTVF